MPSVCEEAVLAAVCKASVVELTLIGEDVGVLVVVTSAVGAMVDGTTVDSISKYCKYQ